ncbi:DUF429 domain-containing protein [Paenibacillus sp. F411]|uniref:DUF429 domain-containing protein n=1 Tax=Paenibacillus sp. F411 TaxID=2820239 RepID=UPI001AAFA589|nr:DUF429 domain-containing protein [Paenibacillus sp. F411]MBO2945651.1 DUF429 domain-containing protein [Paenibacillus sp. F411]
MNLNSKRAITAFGIDMGAFGTSEKTILVRADRIDSTIYLTVYEENPLQVKPNSSGKLDEVKKITKTFFESIKKSGKRLFIDVPIDLQGLPHCIDPIYDWQTYKRPVDRAFEGQAPLARDIGTHVARFSFLFYQNYTSRERESTLGSTVFETYPRATLQRLGLKYEKYKSDRAKRYVSQIFSKRNSLWEATPGNDNPNSRNLRYNVNMLRLKQIGKKVILGDDQFDAIICAITGVLVPIAPVTEGELNELLKKKGYFNSEPFKVADGYVLLCPKHLSKKNSIKTPFFRGISNIYIRTESSWSNDFLLENAWQSINRFD